MGDGSLVQIFTTSAITTPYYKPVQFTGANETGAAGQAVPSFVNGLNIAVTGANDGTQVIWVDVVGPF